MSKLLQRWLATLALMLCASSAQALCTVVCSCNVSTVPVTFGTHNPLVAAPTDSTGSVTVTCGGVVGLLIPFQIDLGKGGSGTYSPRRMKSGSNTLDYNLYLDTNRSQVWGDGSAGTLSVSGGITLDVLGFSPPVTTTIYGRIPGSQTATKPGSYTDSVSVLVTYY